MSGPDLDRILKLSRRAELLSPAERIFVAGLRGMPRNWVIGGRRRVILDTLYRRYVEPARAESPG